MALLLTYYLIAINIVTFIVYGVDKYCARHNRQRVRERTLLLLAALGGSAGAWLAMLLLRHKTLHNKFRFGVPAILLLQAALLVYLFVYCSNLLR